MKILVIDDDPDVIDVVSLTVGMRWPDADVVSASDGATGIQMVETEAPDAVILDIGLPGASGFDVCREVRRFSDVPIIFLTGKDTEADIVKGLQVGADDYVTKPFKPIEFMARLQSVMRRAQVAPIRGDEEPFEQGDLLVDFAQRKVFRGSGLVKLTPTEYQILYHLTKNAGRVLSHKTLLGQVWGREYLEETNYLKVHIQHLRQKLEDDPSSPKWILTERSVGYKFAKTG